MIPGTEAEVRKTARRNALLAAALFVLLAPGLFAQVLPAGQSPTPKKNAIPKKDTVQAIAAKQPHKSINEIRKETLQFGIDSQVVSLLTTLTQEKDAALGSAVIQLLDQSLNTNVQQGALEYLTAVKNWNATSFAEKLLNDRVQQGENGEGTLIVTAIRYITGAKDANSLPILTKLMQDQNLSVAYEAVSSIGKLGGKTQAASLLADLKDPSFSTKLKPQVILSLGQLKSKEAVPELTKILQNQNSDATERRYACEALGKIGDPASLPVIEKALSFARVEWDGTWYHGRARLIVHYDKSIEAKKLAEHMNTLIFCTYSRISEKIASLGKDNRGGRALRLKNASGRRLA